MLLQCADSSRAPETWNSAQGCAGEDMVPALCPATPWAPWQRGGCLTTLPVGSQMGCKSSFWWGSFAHLHLQTLQKVIRMISVFRDAFLPAYLHLLRRGCCPVFHSDLGQSTTQLFLYEPKLTSTKCSFTNGYFYSYICSEKLLQDKFGPEASSLLPSSLREQSHRLEHVKQSRFHWFWLKPSMSQLWQIGHHCDDPHNSKLGRSWALAAQFGREGLG